MYHFALLYILFYMFFGTHKAQMFDRVSWMFHFPRACEKHLGMRNTENHAFPGSIIGSIWNPSSLASVEAGPAPPPSLVQHSQDAPPYAGMTPPPSSSTSPGHGGERNRTPPQCCLGKTTWSWCSGQAITTRLIVGSSNTTGLAATWLWNLQLWTNVTGIGPGVPIVCPPSCRSYVFIGPLRLCIQNDKTSNDVLLNWICLIQSMSNAKDKRTKNWN